VLHHVRQLSCLVVLRCAPRNCESQSQGKEETNFQAMPDLAGLLVLSWLLTGKDSAIHRSHIKARRSPNKYPNPDSPYEVLHAPDLSQTAI